MPKPGAPLRGKALNEAQARAYGYGSRALQAEAIASELEADPNNRARIATLDSHLKTQLGKLSGNSVVGYAGGTIAATGPLVNATVDAIRTGDRGFLDRRFAPILARRLASLEGIGRSVSRGILVSMVANLLTSTLAEPLSQYLRTDEEQQYGQAKLDFVASLLRKESGAAITVQEYLDSDRRYFPQVGERDPVIAQKRAARQQVIRLLQRESGRPLLPPTRGLVRPASEPKPLKSGEVGVNIEIGNPPRGEITLPARPPGTLGEIAGERPPAPSARPQRTPVSVLGQAIEPYKGQDIVAGKADVILRELIGLSEEHINSLMTRAGIPRAKQSAIRVRIKRLR
jgi:hypothetical protein